MANSTVQEWGLGVTELETAKPNLPCNHLGKMDSMQPTILTGGEGCIENVNFPGLTRLVYYYIHPV